MRALLTLVFLTCVAAAPSLPPASALSTLSAAAQETPASTSELTDLVERYAADRAALYRRYDADYSLARRARLRDFYADWRTRVGEIDFDALGVEGRIDHVLMQNDLRYQLGLLDREERDFAEMESLLPFAATILRLHDVRRDRLRVDAREAAETLAELAGQIQGARDAIARPPQPSGFVAFRAAATVDGLRRTLSRWFNFHNGYDPLFTWWAAAPYQDVDAGLQAYAASIRRDIVGIKPDDPGPIIGDPIGADGMAADLEHEMIPYTPEELIEIAEREYAWIEGEFRKAARDMGFGDDWRAALEKVKTLHVEPGEQAWMVRDLAYEAERFLEENDLITVPPLAKEIWRIEMMSPERQRVNPFFTGGEVISVSYPTDEMEHDEKLMSMRGNNPHFSRATVHHELIPGHHLQFFMNERYNTHRQAFRTPFWLEGWPLHWEMLLWDMGFPQTPEDRMGMLFWRAHRAARIIFSLRFHLGTMSPEEAIDFLVEKVGHERENAVAEVRRSFNGSYPPLYQAAYMLGGLQMRALYHDLVGSGQMTNREFHDTVIQGGSMPIELLRARLTGELVARDFRATWRFAG